MFFSKSMHVHIIQWVPNMARWGHDFPASGNLGSARIQRAKQVVHFGPGAPPQVNQNCWILSNVPIFK